MALEGSEHGKRSPVLEVSLCSVSTFGGTLKVLIHRKNLGVKEKLETKLSKLYNAEYKRRKKAYPFCGAVAKYIATSTSICYKPLTRTPYHRGWPQVTSEAQVGSGHQRVQGNNYTS